MMSTNIKTFLTTVFNKGFAVDGRGIGWWEGSLGHVILANMHYFFMHTGTFSRQMSA